MAADYLSTFLEPQKYGGNPHFICNYKKRLKIGAEGLTFRTSRHTSPGVPEFRAHLKN